jgi:hypothetical protein
VRRTRDFNSNSRLDCPWNIPLRGEFKHKTALPHVDFAKVVLTRAASD